MLGSAKGCRTSDRRRCKKHGHVWIVCWKMPKFEHIFISRISTENMLYNLKW